MRSAACPCAAERGQTAAEYVGVLLVVAAVISGVATTSIGAGVFCDAYALAVAASESVM